MPSTLDITAAVVFDREARAKNLKTRHIVVDARGWTEYTINHGHSAFSNSKSRSRFYRQYERNIKFLLFDSLAKGKLPSPVDILAQLNKKYEKIITLKRYES